MLTPLQKRAVLSLRSLQWDDEGIATVLQIPASFLSTAKTPVSFDAYKIDS